MKMVSAFVAIMGGAFETFLACKAFYRSTGLVNYQWMPMSESVPSEALRVYSPMISKVSTLSFTAVESECNPQVKLELCKLKNNEQRETESEVYGGR